VPQGWSGDRAAFARTASRGGEVVRRARQGGAVTALLAIAALGASAAVAAVLVPPAMRLALRFGFVARANPDVPTHRGTMPLLGGLAILGGLAPWIGFAASDRPRWYGLVAGLVLLIALGAHKDRVDRAVSPLAQLVVQIGAACCLWLGGFRIGAGSAEVELAATVAFAVAVINAWNFLDVIDGLAAGTAAVGALVFVALGDRDAAAVAAGLAGACLGYLRYNRPPARVFMGDIGAFVLGVTFAALALDAIARHPRGGWTALAMIVPLGDLAVTAAARVWAGGSPLVGGPQHLPLRLLARGWSPRHIDLAACALTLAAGAAAWLVVR
jgi:UDP-GlcNAc:undecaprenyl-phosphate GlcNAc-1-phosphate transferase